jgi:hypothetical protein
MVMGYTKTVAYLGSNFGNLSIIINLDNLILLKLSDSDNLSVASIYIN